jgi:hypothetical protein
LIAFLSSRIPTRYSDHYQSTVTSTSLLRLTRPQHNFLQGK